MRWLIVWAALAAGVLLTLRGVQGMARQSHGGAIDRTVAGIRAGKPVDAIAREAARTVLRSSSDGSFVALAGVVSADEAIRAGTKSPNGRVWLTRSVSDLRRGLSMAPTDGFAWLRLAGAEYLLNGPSKRVVDAMRMSSFTIRRHFDAGPLQLSLSAALWPQLDEGLQAAARSAVLQQWKKVNDRKGLHQLALTESGRALLMESIAAKDEVQAWIDNRLAVEEHRRRLRAKAPPQPY